MVNILMKVFPALKVRVISQSRDVLTFMKQNNYKTEDLIFYNISVFMLCFLNIKCTFTMKGNHTDAI